MKDSTRAQLQAVNRRFYGRFAAEFSTTRGRPWPGWRQVIDHFTVPEKEVPMVLDAGCGNGRFGAYLASRREGRCRYLGLDGSPELLRFAADRLQAAGVIPELHEVDLLDTDLTALSARDRFDLVVIFGVLHHLPDSARRRDLLRRLGELLTPGGLLAASIWQLERGDAFTRRVVPWEQYNLRLDRRGLEPIEIDDLETGDYLLTWSGDIEDPRYCHFPGEPEIESWIESVAPPLIDRFEADGPSGRDNHYLVFRRRSP